MGVWAWGLGIRIYGFRLRGSVYTQRRLPVRQGADLQPNTCQDLSVPEVRGRGVRERGSGARKALKVRNGSDGKGHGVSTCSSAAAARRASMASFCCIDAAESAIVERTAATYFGLRFRGEVWG